MGSARTKDLRPPARALVALMIAASSWLALPAQAGVAPASTISSPVHRGLYSYLSSVDATASSGVDGLEVSLKMKMADGTCKALNGTRFVARACGNPRWLAATVDGATWSYELPQGFLLRPSDANATVAYYVASTRAHDPLGGFETLLDTGRNRNRFEIYGGP